MSQTPAPLVQFANITKRYPGVCAVDDASFAIERGEVHGLVGENGAGKSTLIKILAGAVARDEGSIYLDGSPVRIDHVHDAERLGIAVIHQELNLVPYFDAAENIFLGRAYPHTRWGRIRWRALRRQARAVLAQLGVDNLPVNVAVQRLSPGQQTMISIARAFAADARLVVMDEPTASLSQQEIDHLYAAVERLRSRGVSVLYVSHRLQEIFDLADRITIMRNGCVVASKPAAALDRDALIRLMTGRTVDTIFPPAQNEIGPTLLRVEGLCGQTVQDVSFTLHAGEVVGVAGLVGAGRSELLRLIFGAEPVRSGRIEQLAADGALLAAAPRSPSGAFRHGIGLVPEERRSQGLVLGRPIFENVTLTHLNRFARGGVLLDRRRELTASHRLGQALSLRAAGLRQSVRELSGGNQQKVVFARCLAGETKILLLDEPTRGVDVGAKQEIYQTIRQLTAQGVGVILVSSELPEVLGLADRVLVLHEGRPTALVDAAGVDAATILRYCYGVV